jgi:hypothetical protein
MCNSSASWMAFKFRALVSPRRGYPTQCFRGEAHIVSSIGSTRSPDRFHKEPIYFSSAWNALLQGALINSLAGPSQSLVRSRLAG